MDTIDISDEDVEQLLDTIFSTVRVLPQTIVDQLEHSQRWYFDRMVDDVQRGIDVLDDHYHDWREAIDPSVLDMSKTCSCVVGQVAGGEGLFTRDFEERIAVIATGDVDGDSLSAEEYGFDLHVGDGMVGLSYNLLQEVWLAKLGFYQAPSDFGRKLHGLGGGF